MLLRAFSSPVLGIMHLIGKDIVVRLKSPDIIFLPISFIINFPVFLKLSLIFLFIHSLPPSLFASSCRHSSVLSNFGLNFFKYYSY